MADSVGILSGLHRPLLLDKLQAQTVEAVSADPLLSTKRRPRFVQVIGWRACAYKLEADHAQAIREGLDSPHDRIHIVALFRKPVAAQFGWQRQSYVHYQTVLHTLAHSKRNTDAADIDGLCHFLPFPAGGVIAGDKHRHCEFESFTTPAFGGSLS